MSFAALVAALLLGLALFPTPLLWAEVRFTRALARAVVRLSEEAVDSDTAFGRIRRAEAIPARTSARIFSIGGFVIAVLSALSQDALAATLIVMLTAATAALAALSDRSPLLKGGAAVLGLICVLAVR